MSDTESLLPLVGRFPFFLHYQGNYKSNLTIKIVDIVEANLLLYFKKPIVSKLSYIVIESVQNMERYSETTHTPDDYCYIFSDKNHFHVITRNTIKNDSIEPLKQRLDHVNSKSVDELREIYTEVLAKGEGTSKGAGLGLIDMARKSKNPLTYQFTPIDDRVSAYKLHIKISLLNDDTAVAYEDVNELVTQLTQRFGRNKNTLFYTGDFSNRFIQTVLAIISNYKYTDQINISSVFKYALIEFTQNMKRHAVRFNEILPGYICIEWRDNKAWMSTFNFINEEIVGSLTEKLDRLNSSSQEKLNEESEEHLTDFSQQGGLGLIDVARLNWPNPINYKLENHTTFGKGIHLSTEFVYE